MPRIVPRVGSPGRSAQRDPRAILASLDTRRSAFGLAAIVGTLGALLIGAGVVAFVGANWELMPRIARFGLLIASLTLAYGTAALLAAREMRVFAESALLVAGLVFAAAIALVGQTYHLSGDFAAAVLLWEIGILGAALMTGSATLTVLALAGAGYWTWLNVFDLELVPHWGSLLLILIAAAMAVRLGAHYTRFVAVVALAFWIGINLVGFAVHYDWSPFEMLAVATTVALTFWATGSLLATVSRRDSIAALGQAMLWPGIGMVLLAVGILQAASIDFGAYETMDVWLPVSGALVIVAAVFAALAAKRGDQRRVDVHDSGAKIVRNHDVLQKAAHHNQLHAGIATWPEHRSAKGLGLCTTPTAR